MAAFTSTLEDNYFAHAINLAHQEKGLKRRMVGFLKTMGKDITSQLDDFRGQPRLSGLLIPSQEIRLNKMLSQVEQSIDSAYTGMSGDSGKYLRNFAKQDMVDQLDVINASVQAPLFSVAMTPLALQTVVDTTLIRGTLASKWWEQQTASAKTRITSAIQLGFAEGEGITEIKDRLIGKPTGQFTNVIVNGKPKRVSLRKGGVVSVSEREAEAMARTAVQGVSNKIREETYHQNEDVIDQVESVSTLDSRTTPLCASYDGLRWTQDGHKPVGHGKVFRPIPRHWNCRSTHVPVLLELEELEAKAISKGINIPEAARASMDGPQPAMRSMDDWLKGKPSGFQRKILGTPGKVRLYREGKMSLRDLTDDMGKVLNLKQIKKNLGILSAPPAMSIPETSLLEKAVQDWVGVRKTVSGAAYSPGGRGLGTAGQAPERGPRAVALRKAVKEAMPYRGKLYRGVAIPEGQKIVIGETIDLGPIASFSKTSSAGRKWALKRSAIAAPPKGPKQTVVYQVDELEHGLDVSRYGKALKDHKEILAGGRMTVTGVAEKDGFLIVKMRPFGMPKAVQRLPQGRTAILAKAREAEIAVAARTVEKLPDRRTRVAPLGKVEPIEEFNAKKIQDERNHFLKQKVTNESELGGGVNFTTLLENEIPVVFKPLSGEADTKHLRRYIMAQYNREVAASIIDEELGLGLVPTTGLKKYKLKIGKLVEEWPDHELEGIGSAQKFMDGFQTPHKAGMYDSDIAKLLKKADKSKLEGWNLLDVIIENTDRHQNNWMFKKVPATVGRPARVDIALIDNGLVMPSKAQVSKSQIRMEPGVTNMFKGKKISAPWEKKLKIFLDRETTIREKLKDIGMDNDAVDLIFVRTQHLLSRGTHLDMSITGGGWKKLYPATIEVKQRRAKVPVSAGTKEAAERAGLSLGGSDTEEMRIRARMVRSRLKARDRR